MHREDELAIWSRIPAKLQFAARDAQKAFATTAPKRISNAPGLGQARHGGMIRGILWGIACVLTALTPLATLAGEPGTGGLLHEVKIGAQLHDAPYMWSGFNKEPYSIDLNLEAHFSPHVVVWHGAIRPVIGATINFEGYTSKAYGGVRWQWERPASSTFFALGLGIAIHDGSTFTNDPEVKQLGRRVLFHDSIELGYRLDAHRSVSLYFEHISNASTAAKNQGLDTIGLRYGYRF